MFDIQNRAIALQRIEADKKRHDDKRGYRRPAPQQSAPNNPSLTNREEHRHYSDNRDSHLLPSDPASHRDYHRHYSENRGSRSLHVNPASHHSNRPSGGSFEPRSQHDETVRTPAASATRGSIRRGSGGSIADGQIIYPVNQNNSGGQSNSRERIPTRDRLSGQSQEYRVPAMERLSGGDTSMVPVIELQDNGGEVAVEPALQPSHLASGSRVPASLRLGSPSVSGNRNKAKATAAAALSKQAGKRNVSKTTSNKRVARSPMQVLSLSKSIAARSKNPPVGDYAQLAMQMNLRGQVQAARDRIRVIPLRSPSVTNCWAQHGNVEFQGLDPIKPSVLSSNFILSASLEVKLELEIHLVSSVSFVGFKVDCACFSAKSSQIGLRTLNVVYGSGASHLKFLPVNIPTASYRCINVVFDYQLFFRTIAMGSKMEILFGFLHFAERDSLLYGPISSCFVRFSSFILPSSLASGLSNSVVNVAL
ncbi:hypothetical protein YC2023_080282 [Brassica napus]